MNWECPTKTVSLPRIPTSALTLRRVGKKLRGINFTTSIHPRRCCSTSIIWLGKWPRQRTCSRPQRKPPATHMQKIYEAFRTGDRESAKEHVAADPTLAIFAAVIFGDAAEVETLLAGNRSLVNAVSSDGWFPLHLAAHFGHADAVRALLNKGAN